MTSLHFTSLRQTRAGGMGGLGADPRTVASGHLSSQVPAPTLTPPPVSLCFVLTQPGSDPVLHYRGGRCRRMSPRGGWSTETMSQTGHCPSWISTTPSKAVRTSSRRCAPWLRSSQCLAHSRSWRNAFNHPDGIRYTLLLWKSDSPHPFCPGGGGLALA